jgi:hypothetical protein
VDLNTLYGNGANDGLDTLKSSGIGGAVVMLGQCPDTVPSWMITEWRGVSSRFDLYVGCYIAAPLPLTSTDQAAFRARLSTVAAAAHQANAKGMAFDAEPYGYPNNAWDNVSGMKAFGQSLDPILLSVGSSVMVYPSSDASWVGSYNDLIQLQDGNCGTTSSCYSANSFGDFIDGLLTGGVKVTLTDASFHWGPQLSGDTWETGVARSVGLTLQRFPGIQASVMPWPDNDEGHGFFSPDEMQYAFDWATRESTGPVFLYQHTLACLCGTWPQWLAAIKAATS